MGFLYIAGCDADDVMKMSVEDKGSDAEDAVIVVGVILVLVFCGLGIWYYFKKLRGDKGAHGFSHAGARSRSPDEIELGGDTPMVTALDGTAGNGGITGGFDMSPLNPDDDDEDALTDDDQSHGIVDEEHDGGDDDDEEQLIGNGTTKGGD